MAKSDKMYNKSPTIVKGEGGKPKQGIKEPTKADGENMGTEGTPLEGSSGEMPINTHQANERREVTHRHIGEHLAMSNRHETEHSSGAADTARHLQELVAMHKRHQDEMKDMHKRHGKSAEVKDSK